MHSMCGIVFFLAERFRLPYRLALESLSLSLTSGKPFNITVARISMGTRFSMIARVLPASSTAASDVRENNLLWEISTLAPGQRRRHSGQLRRRPRLHFFKFELGRTFGLVPESKRGRWKGGFGGGPAGVVTAEDGWRASWRRFGWTWAERSRGEPLRTEYCGEPPL